jgi:Concanavalin A-like lectin/glucanases superfamily/Carbohydrate family 9 binding domain-like
MFFSFKLLSTGCLALVCIYTVASENCLFLAHFNQSSKAEVAKGGCEIQAQRMEVNGGAGYKFKDSFPAPGGADLRKRGGNIIYPAPGNIDARQGTMQFWIKPQWIRKSKKKHYLSIKRIISLSFDQQKRQKFEQSGKTGSFGIIVANTTGFDWQLQFRNFGGWKATGISADIKDWKNDEWHHVTVTWQTSGEKVIYLDGIASASGKYNKLKGKPSELIFGSTTYHIDAEACLDEVRILNTVLNDQQIKRDYELQLNGKEFSVAGLNIKKQSLFSGKTKKKSITAAPMLTGNLHTNAVFSASYTTQPIKLDGKLNDVVWSKVLPISGFKKRNGSQPECDSEIKILYNDKYLYFGCKFIEPKTDKLSLIHDQRDLSIYSDDCFEIILDTNNSPESTYHFVGNMIGGVFDARNGDKKFNARNIISIGTVDNGFWTLEFAIPFADLNVIPPAPGEKWAVRLCRERKVVKENSSVPHCSSGFNQRKALAWLAFKGTIGQSGDIKTSLSRTKFMPGLNKFTVSLKNSGNKNHALTLKVSGGRKRIERKVTLAPAMAEQINFSVPITKMKNTNVSVTLKEAGKTLWRGSLKPGFKLLPLSLEKLDTELLNVESDILRWRGVSLSISNELQAGLNKITKAVGKFKQDLKKAIKAGKTISPAACQQITEAVNNFLDWREQRRLIVWQTSPWRDGSSTDLPSESKPFKLNYRMLGNEWEFRAINVAGVLPGGGMDCRLAVSDFYTDNGTRINRSLIHIYHAPFVRNFARELVTDPLVEDAANIFGVYPAKSQRLWVAVNSKAIKPGLYKGNVTIKPVDVEAFSRHAWITIPINIEVLPVSLPTTDKWPLDAMFWVGGYTPVKYEIPMMKFLKEFHINHVMTQRHRYDVGPSPNGMLCKNKKDFSKHEKQLYREFTKKRKQSPWRLSYYNPANINTNDKFLKAALREKMKVFFAWNSCRDPQWVKLMSEHMIKLGFKYDQFMFSGMSDEFKAKDVAQWLRFHAAAYRAAPNVQYLATVLSVPPPGGITTKQMQHTLKYIQNPIFHDRSLWPPKTARRKDFIKIIENNSDPKLHPWIYRCATGMQKMPILSYYRAFPRVAYLTGTEGIAMWTLISLNGKSAKRGNKKVRLTADGIFDQDDPNGKPWDGLCYYHPRQTIRPTKRFMALVEGLEDYAMISMLAIRIRQKQEAGRTILNNYKQLISINTLRKMDKNPSEQELNSWREKMLNALVALQKQ